MAAATGIGLDRVLRTWLAIGLPIEDPDAKALPADAADTTALFAGAAEAFGEEVILGFSRVMAGAASQVADAAVSLFLGAIQPRLEAGNATELQWAEANEAGVSSLDDAVTVMGRLVREHVIRAVQRSRAARAPDPAEPRELEVAVAFLDLVNSTEWALHETLEAASLALGRFETAAWDASVQHGGRLVKLIGDEAMIVAASPADACTIALTVLAAVGEDGDLPEARGAVGFGTALSRDGDYFGPLVNLVARAVKQAVPGQVVVTAPVRAMLADDARFTTGPLELHHLRGVEEPVALAPLK